MLLLKLITLNLEKKAILFLWTGSIVRVIIVFIVDPVNETMC